MRWLWRALMDLKHSHDENDIDELIAESRRLSEELGVTASRVEAFATRLKSESLRLQHESRGGRDG